MTPWLVGIDVGQVSDPSAMAVVRRKEMVWGDLTEMNYELPLLTRFEIGMPYPEMVRQAKRHIDALPRPKDWDDNATPSERARAASLDMDIPPRPHYTLLIDATGVGRPVADMFREVSLSPIYVVITSGYSMSRPRRDEYHVSKSQFISPLQVVIQSRRIKLARALPEAPILIKEANNFQFKRSEKSGDDQYGAWRSGTHDDLLFAAALAIWYGEMMSPPRRSTRPQGVQFAQATGNVLRRRAG